jgi:S1-C subfamily serine protease
MPPQEQKLEALGTIIAEDGLTVLSLNKVDPTANILSRIRSPGASVNVNYTEVMILMQDGTEVPAKLLLKDSDLDLAFVLPIEERKNEFKDVVFSRVPKQASENDLPVILDEVVSIGKLRKTLYRQSTLRRGWVNAVIEKPRTYFVIENTSPGTPVFNSMGNWLGVVVYKMVSGRPSEIVTLPATDILEIAEQVRTRTQ